MSKNIFPNGVQLAEKSKQIASTLGLDASNGWLDRWKKKHSLKKMTISGESGDVSGCTVDSWKERLPGILIRVESSGEHCLTKDLDRM